jgi:hypothetical protein
MGQEILKLNVLDYFSKMKDRGYVLVQYDFPLTKDREKNVPIGRIYRPIVLAKTSSNLSMTENERFGLFLKTGSINSGTVVYGTSVRVPPRREKCKYRTIKTSVPDL